MRLQTHGRLGTSEHIEGLTATLEIDSQVGCVFSGTNSWTNGDVGADEHFAGVVHGSSGTSRSFSLLEHEEQHGDAGSTAAVEGELEGGVMKWHYGGTTTTDGSETYAVLFDAFFGLTTAPDHDAYDCDDKIGNWATTADYDAIKVDSANDETWIGGLSAQIKITEQDGCEFHGVNVWTNGDVGGTESIAGILHQDGSSATFVELDGHPTGGSSGIVHAVFDDDDTMLWSYCGAAEDNDHVICFASNHGHCDLCDDDASAARRRNLRFGYSTSDYCPVC